MAHVVSNQYQIGKLLNAYRQNRFLLIEGPGNCLETCEAQEQRRETKEGCTVRSKESDGDG